VTRDGPDGGGTDSATTSDVASGEDEPSVATEVMGAVAAEMAFTLAEEAGEVGEASFLANDFFSLARLF
jgi:hypothetical protein